MISFGSFSGSACSYLGKFGGLTIFFAAIIRHLYKSSALA